jgi:hypothetical protein
MYVKFYPINPQMRKDKLLKFFNNLKIIIFLFHFTNKYIEINNILSRGIEEIKNDCKFLIK